jgi:hypothetical protein
VVRNGRKLAGAAALAAAVLAGCNGLDEKAAMPEGDPEADLRTLAESRVYFGHQSVGRDILDGLKLLAEENGVALRIVEAPEGATDTLPGLVHSKVGKNREPMSKCEAFGRFVSEHAASRWDAAAFKFCYVDLGDEAGRDPAKLLEMYRAAVAAARAARPDLNLVHVTIPLKSDPLGIPNAIKRAIGMGTAHDEDNVLRNAFNDLLRAEYAGEPLFDLARAESTLPDGSRTGFKRDGKTVYTLAKQYTYDAGHLNQEGMRHVAAEFARAMAAAIRARPRPETAPVAAAGEADGAARSTGAASPAKP